MVSEEKHLNICNQILELNKHFNIFDQILGWTFLIEWWSLEILDMCGQLLDLIENKKTKSLKMGTGWVDGRREKLF